MNQNAMSLEQRLIAQNNSVNDIITGYEMEAAGMAPAMHHYSLDLASNSLSEMGL